MWETFKQSLKSFLKGQLFQDQKKAVALGMVGVGITLVVFFVGSRFMPLWLAGAVAGLAGGIAQPFLFKNLKFK